MRPFLLLVLVSLFSCEKWKVSSFKQSEVYVLNAQIAATDSLISVYFGRTAGLNEASLTVDQLVVPDAILSIRLAPSEEFSDDVYPLNFDKQSKRYQLEAKFLKLKPGTNYLLRAFHKGSQVEAEFILPKTVSDIEFEKPILTNGLLEGTVNLKSPEADMVFDPNISAVVINRGIRSQSFGTWNFDQSSILKSKEPNEEFRLEYRIENVPVNATLSFEMLILEKNGLSYLESIRNANDTPRLSQEFLDRFISPSIRFSNVKNGLGIVLGYERVVKEIEL